MSNQFLGLVSDDLLENFKQAIDEIIRISSKPAKLVYPTTKWETCTDCAQSISAGSPNPYISANKGKFSTSCPTCGGTFKKPVENSETLSLCVIFDYKKFKDIAGISFVPQGDCQTFCRIELINKIKTCKYAIFNTDIEIYNKHQFTRMGEPTPVGFADSFIITSWQVAG